MGEAGLAGEDGEYEVDVCSSGCRRRVRDLGLKVLLAGGNISTSGTYFELHTDARKPEHQIAWLLLVDNNVLEMKTEVNQSCNRVRTS